MKSLSFLAIAVAIWLALGCGANGQETDQQTQEPQTTQESGTPGPTGVTAEPSPGDSPEALAVVIPIFNRAGLQVALSTFEPYIRPGDIFVLISGNNTGEFNDTLANDAAAQLEAKYPNAAVIAGTSGLANLSFAAQAVTRRTAALLYTYEPDLANEPEFSWDFNTTLTNFDRAAEAARSTGLGFVGYPTGRPILDPGVREFNWHYGLLAQRADRLIIQTQAYCQGSPQEFGEAVDKVLSQYSQARANQNWFPQVTIDPEAPNGTPVGQAHECAKIAEAKGLTGIMMWWSPRHADAAVEFLSLLER